MGVVARFIDDDATVSDAWWIAVPLALAIAIRPIAVVAAVAVVMVIEIRGQRDRPRVMRWIVAAPSVLAVVAVVAWQLGVDVQLDDPRTAVHRSVLSSLTDAVGSLPRTAIEAVDSLGWNEFRAPMPASIAWAGIWVALLGVTIVGARRRGAYRELVAIGAWLVVLVATPIVFETLMAGSVGPIWQGRYSLPMLVGLVALVAVPMWRSRRVASARDRAGRDRGRHLLEHHSSVFGRQRRLVVADRRVSVQRMARAWHVARHSRRDRRCRRDARRPVSPARRARSRRDSGRHTHSSRQLN